MERSSDFLLFISIFAIVSGMALLLKIDIRAENVYAVVAPLLILSGYAGLGVFIMTRPEGR